MKIKTSELTGTALDWVVGKLELVDFYFNEFDGICRYTLTDNLYNPTEEWAIGGPIIEQQEIGIRTNAPCSAGHEWEASPSITAKGAGGRWGYGPTPLIAAMRCYVASNLGDEVEVPDELIN